MTWHCKEKLQLYRQRRQYLTPTAWEVNLFVVVDRNRKYTSIENENIGSAIFNYILSDNNSEDL